MKIATALDRPPSQFFKKWVSHHINLFDKNNFIFLNFGKSNDELKEYLKSKGFESLVTLTVAISKHGNINYFNESLGIIFQKGIDSENSFIIHCPLDQLIHPDFGVYRQFISESTLVINQLKNRVLENNHKFIFLDSDELLVCKNINKILESDFTQIVPAGYTVVQNSDEGEFDWNKPLHKQRSYWKREAQFYDKPIIIQENIEWGNGRHAHHHDYIPVNEEVTLLHLRDVCFNYLYNENLCTNALYPDKPNDHRSEWEEKPKYDKWVEKRQSEVTPIIKEVKVLLKKYNI